jgi:hypothetical protein
MGEPTTHSVSSWRASCNDPASIGIDDVMETGHALIVVQGREPAAPVVIAARPDTTFDPPGWARLAAARDIDEHEHVVERVVGYVVAPAALLTLVVAGFVASVGWWVGLALGAALIVVTTLVMCSAPVRRLRLAHAEEHLRRRAFEARSRILLALSESNRLELQRLSQLVDNVHAHALRRSSATTAEVPARLDQMLLAFVDRARELEIVTIAFARTREDALDDDDARAVARITRLRRAARDACRRRIEGIEADLVEIGQAIRLVHEQTFAHGLLQQDVHDQIDELVAEASHLLEAGEETVQTCAALQAAAHV